MADYGKDPYVEKTIQEVLWRDYHNFYRRKRLKERKKQIAKHNKRWKAYLLKHAHPRKLGRYHREAAERNVPVQEVNMLFCTRYKWHHYYDVRLYSIDYR